MDQVLSVQQDKLIEAQLKQINVINQESVASEKIFSDIFFTLNHFNTECQQ